MEPVEEMLRGLGADVAASARGGWVVRVPSHRRGQVAAHVSERERTLTIRAFLMRGPDRRQVDVYRRLLEKNLETRLWRLALDADGDIVAVADLDRSSLGADLLDGALGALSSLVDEIYDGVLHTGFVVP